MHWERGILRGTGFVCIVGCSRAEGSTGGSSPAFPCTVLYSIPAEPRPLQGWVGVFQVENRCLLLLEGSWLSFFKGGMLLQRCTERLKIEHTLEHSKWHTSDKGALIRGDGSSTLKRRRRTHAERKYNNTCWVNKHTRQDIRTDWVSFSFKTAQPCASLDKGSQVKMLSHM